MIKSQISTGVLRIIVEIPLREIYLIVQIVAAFVLINYQQKEI